MGTYRNDGWDSHRRESGIQPGQQFDHNAPPHTLEELELEYKKEAMELMKIRDREEDEENLKHREVCSLENNMLLHTSSPKQQSFVLAHCISLNIFQILKSVFLGIKSRNCKSRFKIPMLIFFF